MIYLNRLQLDHGLGLAQRALAIARAAGHDQELGTALDCLKLAALQLGDLELLDRTVAEIVAVQERTRDVYFIQWAYLEGAMGPLARGDHERAQDLIDKAIAINDRFTTDRITRSMIFESRSWIHRACGDLDAAVSTMRAAVEHLGELTAPEWSAWLGASLGSHLIELGDLAGAIPVLETALASSETIKSPNRTLRAASHLAWARALVGDRRESQAALTLAEGVLATITAPPGDVFLGGYHSYLAIARTRFAFDDAPGGRAVLTPLLAAARRRGWLDAEQETSRTLATLGA